MNVIFAVVNKVKHEYHSLVQEIRGASLGLLDAGENIADLIKGQYEVGFQVSGTHNESNQSLIDSFLSENIHNYQTDGKFKRSRQCGVFRPMYPRRQVEDCKRVQRRQRRFFDSFQGPPVGN